MIKYTHTQKDYIEAAARSFSISDMCRILGIIPAGGNYATIKKNIAIYKIDVSHFTGKAGSYQKNYSATPKSREAIKGKLIRERGHQCEDEDCLLTTWKNKPITLELEHVDGDNLNNTESNLLLLCPNCHSYTKTWRRAKSSFIAKEKSQCSCGNVKQSQSERCIECHNSKRITPKNTAHSVSKKYCLCGNVKSKKSDSCFECYNNNRVEKIQWPSDRSLIEMLKTSNYAKVGRRLHVSDNAVRKRVKSRGLDSHINKMVE